MLQTFIKALPEPLRGLADQALGLYLAVARLRSEGVGIGVLPLGELPWPTKAGSHLTSLALAGRPWSETQVPE
jgi:hypothetical protein